MVTPEEHDARSGFHDIKPPLPVDRNPGVLSQQEDIVLLFLLLLLAFLLGTILILRRNRSSPKHRSTPKLVFDRSIKNLTEALRSQSLAPRILAGELSETLRVYLEQSLLCPATDCTPSEMKQMLQSTKGANHEQDIYAILVQLERLAFGTGEILEREKHLLPELCQTAQQIGDTLHIALGNEEVPR